MDSVGQKLKKTRIIKNIRISDVSKELRISEEILSHLRIKKLYIDYLIPAKERDIQIDEHTGEEYKLVTKGAIIIAVGYHNL